MEPLAPMARTCMPFACRAMNDAGPGRIEGNEMARLLPIRFVRFDVTG
jgi:hypothetical protein